jgi:hypothetical protein
VRRVLRHGITGASLLDVTLVGKRLRGVHGHVRHAVASGYVCRVCVWVSLHRRSTCLREVLLRRQTLLRREAVRSRLVRGVNLIGIIDTILIAGCRLWGVQTSLRTVGLGRNSGGDTVRKVRVLGEAYLNQILALSLGDERLQLGGREGVDQARLRYNEQKNLSAGQDGQLVSMSLDWCQLARRPRL